jgi:P-type Ca2+ transporter type 2C
MDAEAVFERLDSGEDGLDEAQAKQRLEKGAEFAGSRGRRQPVRLLARQVHNPLIYLLIGAAVLSFVIGHRVDAAVIAGVVVLNTLLGFFQEWRAEGALNALRKMAAHHARVLRDGKPWRSMPPRWCPGMCWCSKRGPGGRRCPHAFRRQSASGRIRPDRGIPTRRQAAGKAAEDAPMADRHNMVWMSTSVTGGRGRAVVVETGMRTAMGRIAGEVRATVRESTPLQKRMHKLGMVLGIGGVALAAGCSDWACCGAMNGSRC